MLFAATDLDLGGTMPIALLVADCGCSSSIESKSVLTWTADHRDAAGNAAGTVRLANSIGAGASAANGITCEEC